MSNINEKFVEVCSDYLKSKDGYKVRGEQGVFSFAVVVWLGVQQRIKGNSLKNSLSSLVEQAKGSGLDFLVNRVNAKLTKGNISLNTGGLSRARDRVLLEQVKELFFATSKKIISSPSISSEQRNIYVLDGQVIAIPRSKSNLDYFCATGNGEGELHCPRIRIVSAHELRSGVASEVAVGNWRTSEVGLSSEVAEKLPPNSLLVMDRGFAKPSFLEVVIAKEVKVLVRLKNGHGKKLLSSADGDDSDKKVKWVAKLKDGRKVELEGRVIRHKSEIKGFRSSEFYFFTTEYDLSSTEIADLYRQRVRVEVFIRDIKQTLDMSFINSQKGENVEKEIYIAYLTFNLVRSIMEDSANALALPVERMSFSSTIALIKAYAHSFANAENREQVEKLKLEFFKHMNQAKLPDRKKERSYQRVIKYPRQRYALSGVVEKSKHYQDTCRDGK